MKVHTVHAYRWGDKEAHSYLVGVYESDTEALKAAKAHEKWRGGKYECEVLGWELGNTKDNGSGSMEYEVIKPIHDSLKKLRKLNYLASPKGLGGEE